MLLLRKELKQTIIINTNGSLYLIIRRQSCQFVSTTQKKKIVFVMIKVVDAPTYLLIIKFI